MLLSCQFPSYLVIFPKTVPFPRFISNSPSHAHNQATCNTDIQQNVFRDARNADRPAKYCLRETDYDVRVNIGSFTPESPTLLHLYPERHVSCFTRQINSGRLMTSTSGTIMFCRRLLLHLYLLFIKALFIQTSLRRHLRTFRITTTKNHCFHETTRDMKDMFQQVIS